LTFNFVTLKYKLRSYKERSDLMINKLTTELRNSETMNLDQLETFEILKKMNSEFESVSQVIRKELYSINQAVQLITNAFNEKGRLFYIGAGTSGRLGILDAVECVPTFSTPKQQVQGIIAGGMKAITYAIEGAEDDEEKGSEDLKQVKLTNKDVVVGITASGRTPYVIGALKYSNKIGANTIGISNNIEAQLSFYANVAIELETGPEVLTGSTRLKAGTAQKNVLNMLSTVSMIKMGKVYQNLMVDLKPTNQKLEKRSIQIIKEATEVDEEIANYYYRASDFNIKIAIVMILLNCDKNKARKKVHEADGFVQKALT